MMELTKAEEQVMQILWKMEKGFVKEVVDQFDEPKPAYNTVSTIIRILEKKGIVGYKVFGNTHEYFPIISKKDYTKKYMNNFIRNYFGNSFKKMVSFFSKQEELSIKELEELKLMMEKMIEDKKANEH
jgi:BlaI family penicillinase repressor